MADMSPMDGQYGGHVLEDGQYGGHVLEDGQYDGHGPEGWTV